MAHLNQIMRFLEKNVSNKKALFLNVNFLRVFLKIIFVIVGKVKYLKHINFFWKTTIFWILSKSWTKNQIKLKNITLVLFHLIYMKEKLFFLLDKILRFNQLFFIHFIHYCIYGWLIFFSQIPFAKIFTELLKMLRELLIKIL